MRKVIEADLDMKKEKEAERSRKSLAGLAAMSLLDKSSNKRNRQKLLNDIMYYLRKLINLAKQVQNLSEGVNDIPDEDLTEFEKIKSEIDKLEETLKEKS